MKQVAMLLAVVAAVLVLGACGSPAGGERGTGTQYSAVLGNDFTGNYLKVYGKRSVPADGKYPCLNEFEVCLGLDPTGATAAVKDLCPSVDTPEGTWSFSYVIYADAGCVTPLANLGCMPTEQEFLVPGSNHNQVTCITRNADKSFDVCVMDPVTGAGSEACPPCIPGTPEVTACNPI